MVDIIIDVGPNVCFIKPNKNIKPNYDFINKICSFTDPNAQYTPQYKEGTWDGQYHMFNMKNKSFPTGLLDKILDVIDIDCFSYEINQKFKTVKKNPNKWNIGNINFRDYQIKCIDKAIKYERGIFQLPTGSGKTILAIGIIAAYGLPTLFLVHTKDLLYQAYNVFKELIPAKIGIIGDGNIEDGDIIVATVQTMANKIQNKKEYFGDFKYDMSEKYGDDFELKLKMKPTHISTELVNDILHRSKVVFVDECHITPATSFYKTILATDTYHKFGLSATPERTDGKELKIESGIGKILHKITVSDLIKKGYLIKPIIHIIPIPAKRFGKSTKYNTVYQQYIVDNEERNSLITQIIKFNEKNHKQTLVFVKLKRHLNQIYLNCDINTTAIIEGSMKTEEREEILSQFNNEEIPTLIGTSLIDEGLNLPCIESIIIAGGGKSTIKTKQRIGRALRPFDRCPNCFSINVWIKNINEPCICKDCQEEFEYNGKKEVHVYDFKDNSNKWLFGHFMKRKTVYEEEGFEVINEKVTLTSKN